MSVKNIETTVLELAESIVDALKKNNGEVSALRSAAVESQLRTSIHNLGYKPRETSEKKATISELADQLVACLEEIKGEIPDKNEHHVRSHVAAALSNIKADGSVKMAPALKEIPKAAALILVLLLAMLLPARAQQSFNSTNVVYPAVAIVSYPTNVISTNFVVTGYSTNGVVITTNGYYLGTSTGGGIETRNYTFVGFVASGQTVGESASANEVVTLVRSGSANPPSASTNWESTASITLTIPLPQNGNFYWMTNLDEWYTKPAAWEGIYSITNAGTTGYITNQTISLIKKIIPFSLSGGNY